MNVGCKQQLFRDGPLRREFDHDFLLLEQSLAERIESQCHPKDALKGNLTARSISSGITILYRPTGAPDPPHMLRHSTGNKLANDGHYNPGATTHGSPNIMHTVRTPKWRLIGSRISGRSANDPERTLRDLGRRHARATAFDGKRPQRRYVGFGVFYV